MKETSWAKYNKPYKALNHSMLSHKCEERFFKYLDITYDSFTKDGLKGVLLSRDQRFNFDSLLIKNIPAPWDLPQGFIIQVL